MRVARLAAVAVGLAVFGGCAGSPSPEESPSASPTEPTAEFRVLACAGAAQEVVAAVEGLVAVYSARDTEVRESRQSPPSPEDDSAVEQPATDDRAASEALAAAIASSQRTVENLRCDTRAFNADVSAGLAEITPSGAVATAVWRRVSASVLGQIDEEVTELVLEQGDDLHEAVSRAAPGSTIVLPATELRVDSTIVLLDGVSLRGQTRQSSVLISSAAEAGIIVATDGLVRLDALTLRLDGPGPVSGLVAGPSASVALGDVRVTGARRGEDSGAGGAGLLMSAEGDLGSGRGTTLEVTDSAFDDNAWAGIAVAGGHRVSIEAVTFEGNGEVGILFMDSSTGSVTSSTFSDNMIGLAATGAASPTWLSSTVTGGSIGMQVDGSANVVVQDLSVTGAESAAALVGGQATGAITGLVCENSQYGIVVGDSAAPTLADNDCSVSRGG